MNVIQLPRRPRGLKRLGPPAKVIMFWAWVSRRRQAAMPTDRRGKERLVRAMLGYPQPD